MILLVSLVLAQSTFTYSDAKGDLSIRARDGQGSMVTGGYTFELKGGVMITSKKDKFTLNANQVKANIVSVKGTKGLNQIQSAVATGSIRLIQSSLTGTATLTSASATYKTVGKNAQVDAKGSVRITNVNSVKKESMVATGSSATAILSQTAKQGLSSATLNGPVRVELNQATDKSKIIFTGNRLTLDGKVATLTGNVKASGQGASQFGNLGNVDSVTVLLNEKGEMSSFRFRSGGGN